MTITINIGDKTRSILMPSRWNDLVLEDEKGNRNPAPAMTLLSILQGQAGLTAKRIAIVKFLLQLSPQDIKDWQTDRAFHFQDHWQTVFFAEIQELLHATEFLLQPIEEDLKNDIQKTMRFQLNPTLTKCPFPTLTGIPSEFKSSRRTYTLHAPDDDLSNLTAEEVAFCFDIFEAYTKTKKTAYVDEIIAILYRPGKPATPHNIEQAFFGDIRQPYNPATVPLRQAQIAKMPLGVKNIIFFWFLSCRLAIVERYKAIFKEASGQEKQGGDYGWLGVFRNIAGNLKDTAAIAAMNHREVLIELDMLENQRLLAEMNKLGMAA